MKTRPIADVFVCRENQFLILQRVGGSGGRGKGWWASPGGMVESGEDVTTAGVREVLEETGLRIERPETLRRWRWQLPEADYVYDMTTMIASAPEGGITLSIEHTDHDWITPADYTERFCSPQLAVIAPDYAEMFAEIRKNCMLAARRMCGPLS